MQNPLRVISVKPKKRLGQHFLTDKNIARKIVQSLTWENYSGLLEIGPGMGVLTEFLLEIKDKEIFFVEIDKESVAYLTQRFPHMEGNIMACDVLNLSLDEVFDHPFAIIGNFPYNISSQLFFKILESRERVAETVCMIQKEVAVRIASPPGSKNYGILSVLLQAYYHIEYLFTVSPQVFNPPPNVQSAVIRLRRNSTGNLGCTDALFKTVVKTAFNQRRKTLRNSLKKLFVNLETTDVLFQKRPEQLGIDEFIRLTRMLEQARNGS